MEIEINIFNFFPPSLTSFSDKIPPPILSRSPGAPKSKKKGMGLRETEVKYKQR